MSWFVPVDKKEQEQGNRGDDVPDYCINCHHPFMSRLTHNWPRVGTVISARFTPLLTNVPGL
jgi:hypothetical protein